MLEKSLKSLKNDLEHTFDLVLDLELPKQPKKWIAHTKFSWKSGIIHDSRSIG